MKSKNKKNIICKVGSVFLMLLMFVLNLRFASKVGYTNGDNIEKDNFGNKTSYYSKTGLTVNNHVFHKGEMRAVWISYITLDMSGTDRSEQAFKKKIDNIIETSLQNSINTLIIHVRSHFDAIYKSEYYPYSHILSGEQGVDPGYDALKYIVKASHKAGLEVHAWINPFRIKTSETPKKLSDDNPYMIWKNDKDTSNDRYAVEWEGGIYLNPAYPEVRELIINGVRELIENYDVDGIHFDDYFYPTPNSQLDKYEYDEYAESVGDNDCTLTLSEWRNTNINSLIYGVYSAIKCHDSKIVFGISPQGNISNNETIAADIKSWGAISGYVDYLCPQIYVNFDHPLLPFNEMCDSWRKLVSNTNTKLYCGLALYKANSDSDEGTWHSSNDILAKELEYLRKCGYDGYMLYSWDYLDCKQTMKEMSNFINTL